MSDDTEIHSPGRVVRTFDDGLVVLRLDSPRALNALSSQMLSALAREIRAASDDPAVRGVVVTGTGRAFSAGEDLRETRSLVESEGISTLSRLFNAVTEAVLECRAPCLAAVNGVAVGGAAELTLCFDRRVGTSAAGFIFPESSMGFTISNAASFLLPSLLGSSRALELVLTGRRADAEECLRIGLLDEIVEQPDDLLDRCREFAHACTPSGNSSRLQLRLLRPNLSRIQRAFDAEASAAEIAWDSGLMNQTLRKYDA